METSHATHRQPLVIHCTGHDPDRFNWYWRSADGRLHSGDRHTPLPAADAVLLLPASQMIFQQATLRHCTPQTLSWQLESLALSDPEQLHTVVLHREGEQVWLAAIDRAWLRRLLDNLRAQGVQTLRALPDALVPEEGDVLRVGDRWLIRHQRWQGMSLDDEQAARLQPLEPLLASVRPAAAADEVEQFYRQACQQRITLLQGEFAARLSLRPARAFALSCALCSMLILLVPPLWSGWQASQQASEAQQQSLALYQRFFPHESPARPAHRLAERLEALANAPEGTGPLQLLVDSAAMLATLHNNPLQTLQWDEQQQRLHLSFTRVLPDRGLNQNGLTVEIEGNKMIVGRKS